MKGLQIPHFIVRKKDLGGKFIYIANYNPLPETHVYEVRFDDGIVQEYSTNSITEKIYYEVDNSGTEYLLLEFVDNKFNGISAMGDDSLI